MLALVLPAVGWVFRGEDPFFLDGAFPYLLIPALVSSLHHGFAHGFFSAGVLVGGAFLWSVQSEAGSIETAFGIGVFLVAMIGGEFRNYWRRTIRRSTAGAEYSRKRLQEFSNEYHVLKISHDRLEQKFAGTVRSLRESLREIQQDLIELEDGEQPLKRVGDKVLALLARACQIQVAELLVVDRRGMLEWPGAAHLGEARILERFDPLLSEALWSGQLVHVAQESTTRDERRKRDTRLLCALPLVDVNDRVWAIVAVEEMPFAAFAEENLKILAVLGARLGDTIGSGVEGPTAGDTQEQEFHRQLRICLRDRTRYDLSVSVVQFVMDEGVATNRLVEFLCGQRRGLDTVWVFKNAFGQLVVSVLLPLTDVFGLRGYANRSEIMAKELFGGGLAELGVQTIARELDVGDESREVMDLLTRVREIDEDHILVVG